MMPMEASRVSNLNLAEQGRYSELRRDKVQNEAMAMMGDPNAVVLDRHQARVSEKPSAGIFANTEEGKINPGPDYQLLKRQFEIAAQRAGRSPRDYSADVWTGIRETLRNKSELYGTKYQENAVRGESKSYADIYDDVVVDKARHMGITPAELERRLERGDVSLLSAMLAVPAIGALLAGKSGPREQPPDL